MRKQIRAKPSSQRLVIGIDGLSRSGKTTFAELLGNALKQRGREYSLFHLDEFITKKRERYHTGFEEWYEYYLRQWDVESLTTQLFQKASAASSLTLSYYNEKRDKHETRKVHLPENGVIIIEGVFLQREEWLPYLDYVIYIDCSKEVRFSRESWRAQMDRNKFIRRYWKAENFYLNEVNPRNCADKVINNG